MISSFVRALVSCAPQKVDPVGYATSFFADHKCWTSFWPRLPTPEQPKPFPVPQNERIGLDHDKGFLPVE